MNVQIGVSGWPPRGKDRWTNWDWWYMWSPKGISEDLRVTPLHKLQRLKLGETPNPDIHACDAAIDRLVEVFSGDTKRTLHTQRWCLLFNEPDNGNESDWLEYPKDAAAWATRTMRAIRWRCPWVRFVGPNMLGLDEAWVDEFLWRLHELGDAFDAYGIHGYYPLYQGMNDMTVHLEGVRAHYDGLGLVPGYQVWITEIGYLQGESQSQVLSGIQTIEDYLTAEAERLGIARVAWFIPRSGLWTDRSPNTVLNAEDGQLTRTGRRWYETWRRFSPRSATST